VQSRAAADADPSPSSGEAEERAVALAYRAVAARERTEAELRALLARRGVEEGPADLAVRELAGAGYLDDASYARRFVEDKRALAGWGSERIARALEDRGVGPDLIAAALAHVGQDDELEAALALLARRFPAAALALERERGRAWRLLVRRGYGVDLAYEAVRRHGRAQRPERGGEVAAPRRAE
jgi:regulatory protein